MPESNKAVHGALLNVPHLARLSPSDYSVLRLGGLTNLVYRVEFNNEKLIVRIPGDGTGDYIDRKVELHNATAAANAGISAEIVWADAKSGVMISRCFDPVVTMTPKLFQSREGSPERAAHALRKLHHSGESFQFRFELFAMIDDYLAVLSGKNAKLPEGYNEVVEAAAPVKQLLEENPAALAPCHNDPLCENFLDDGARMWIVDWEYSGMNDPMWDLSDLSVEAGFDAAQDAALLRAYFGGEVAGAQAARMIIYKAMCDLLWTLWGLIQHADGNQAEDFWAYATGRLERCKSLMLSPDFTAHLAAVRAG